jgi:serine protease
MTRKIIGLTGGMGLLLAGLTVAGAALTDHVATATSAATGSTGGTAVGRNAETLGTDQVGRVARPSPIADGETIIKLKLRPDARLRDATNGRLALPGADELSATLDQVAGLRVQPLFTLSAEEQAGLSMDAKVGTPLAADDLDAWYQVVVPAGTDAAAMAKRLAATAGVETAFVPRPTSTPTADYSKNQGYRRGAPLGVDVAAAANLVGGQGERVKIFDVEFSWNTGHEDLGRAANGFIENGTSADPFKDTNHGTSVLGEITGTSNGFGVTGIAPKAAIGMVNAYNLEHKWDVAGAILVAAAHAKAGDVILIEQQLAVTAKKGDWGPVEYEQDSFDAIRTATRKGIIVVEAAGNGYRDLDALGIGRSDSGAIMVGAGQVDNCPGYGSSGHPRSRAEYSNYGSRVDVQAWGECVTTTGHTGWGDYAGGTFNSRYTYTFSGTSSASPIVTGAVAILSSVIEARTGKAATPAQIRSLLKSTGTPQDLSAGALKGHIGPMPNLRAALAKLGAADGNGGENGGQDKGGQTGDRTGPTITGPKQAPGAGYALTNAGLVPTTISWGAEDASGIARYSVKVSTNGGAWADIQLSSATAKHTTLDLVPGRSYQFIVAARDGAGNWSEWAKGPTFKAWTYDETADGISYSNGWVRAAWDPALGGTLAVSGQAGATARVRFTGRGIAWIATMATNRGQARVWLDDTYLGTIDLYRESTLARAMVLARRVSAGDSHELVIQVVGTEGRPKVDLDGIVIVK